MLTAGVSTNNACPHPDTNLQFDANFENGNLERVEKVQQTEQEGVEEYYITLSYDPQPQSAMSRSDNDNDCPTNNNAVNHAQWFHFRVQNVKANVTYKFKIINMTKSL